MRKRLIISVGICLSIVLMCLIAFFLRIYVFSKPTTGERIGEYENPKSALLVIDIQEDFTGKTAKPPFPYKDSDKFISEINNITNTAVKKNIDIVYIKQVFSNNLFDYPVSKGRVIKGTTGSEIDSRVNIVSSDIFTKWKSDAFSNNDLEVFLTERQINQLYIVGLDARGCVYKTSIGAINRNYKVTVIKDAVVTLDMSKLEDVLSKYKRDGIEVINVSEF